ncbi:ABC transporter ATP-binding protein [Parenemella sanctibonifatiensis]|uniref:ABC transporter n=1 Tax=Parenemella sanctibonifatiensis TaxID=2016505 RepID=A0A255EM03_9ACTN|nr:ABC transporter ATP-binding protein [Parenemella sanctibonifatiensis]OYN92240.1 ABC transporter [Parenemella sanctibonifatiensis]
MAIDNSPAIEIQSLTKTYGANRAVDNLDLSLSGNQIVGLLGQNGCGKTTLLKVLAGVLADYSGDVRIAGHEPGPQSKAKVAFLPDASLLSDGATPRFCIGMYADFFADFNRTKAAELLDFFGLDLDMRLKQMSKGMREKVQIALVMARRAEVYLLDEPISGVDPAARQVILDGIISSAADEALVVVSTHLIHDLEPVLDAAVIMRAGTVVLTGAVDDLRVEHQMSLDALFRKVHAA